MKKILPLISGLAFLLGSCISYQDTTNATPTPGPDLAGTISAGISATQTAVVETYQPSFPYSTLELAGLMVPGELLEGTWQPSTVYDLTQPYPPMPEWCGEYYNGCAEIFENNIANYGVELELLHEGYQLGEAALLYYQDLGTPDALFQHIQEKRSASEENIDPEVNEIWMYAYNPFQREELGDRWMHLVGYRLFDFTGPEADETYGHPEREFNQIEITFTRCHMLVELDLRFPVENPWNSPEDNLEARSAEQEARFDLVYDYARAIAERITPYACNP